VPVKEEDGKGRGEEEKRKKIFFKGIHACIRPFSKSNIPDEANLKVLKIISLLKMLCSTYIYCGV
jgi:hypothetical protein